MTTDRSGLRIIVHQVIDHLKQIGQDGSSGLKIPPRSSTGIEYAADETPAGNQAESLESIRSRLGDCTRCKLHIGRKNIVFGEGSMHPEVVFVGEGPGRDEDIQGRPFVGRAGQLLDRIIHAMGLSREVVYICNIVKCRPPNNRTPEPDEIQICSPFLIRQLDCLAPRVICALGLVAARFLLNSHAPIGVLRGKFQDFKGIRVMPTYHPAALLRNPSLKRPVWEDIQSIMRYLNESAGK